MKNSCNTVVCVIPARGGSKGVIKKNIRYVLGKPLIGYAIECGLSCPSIEHVMVSTDDESIAETAKQFGADVPFLRPGYLAEDLTPMLPVLQHALLQAEKFYAQKVETLILLDPTAPLRTVADVEECYILYRESGSDAVLSGNHAHRNPYFNMVVKKKDETVRLAIPQDETIACRQDAPEVFDLNTVVWIYSRKALMEEKKRIPAKSSLYIVPSARALDIDTEFDIELLEYTLAKQRKGVS